MLTENEQLENGLISVVMSNYNTPVEYLKQAIDSVLDQTYADFEFIIIDDGSTDGSTDFIKSYSDPRIKLVYNEKNLGLTRSLNKGFSLCRGEFIARMDSDDVCAPERFAEQLAFLRDNPDVIVCGTQIEPIDSRGQTLEKSIYHNEINDMEAYRICLLFGNHPTIQHPSAMFSRKLLFQFNIRYDEGFRYAQDYRMWVNCSKCARCAIIQKPLVKYRSHDSAISSGKYDEQCECAYRVMQVQLDSLHLDFSREIMLEQFKYLRLGYKTDLKYKEWIYKIIAANKQYKIYNQKKLERIVWRRLAYACYQEIKASKLITKLYIFKEMPFKCKTASLRFWLAGDNMDYNPYEGTIKRIK